MDRRVNAKLVRLLAAAGAVAAVLTLISCPGSLDLLDAVTTEVMVASRKFLVVNSAAPTDDNVNPGSRLAIVFDRALETSTISDTSVVVSELSSTSGLPDPVQYWEYEFNASTKTLYVSAYPYMRDNTNYQVTLGPGLKGADGSSLQESYVWTYRTTIYPAGNVLIKGSGDRTIATSSTSVTLEFSYNPAVIGGGYRYTLNEEADPLSGKGFSSIPDGNPFPQSVTLANPDGLDGIETVWVQFQGPGPSFDQSLVVTDTIILDRAPPVVSDMPTAYINIANQAMGYTPSVTATDATSGIESYSWTTTGGLTFSDASVLAPVINASSDGIYYADLVVKDFAGWSTLKTLTVIRDTVTPGKPVFTAETTTSPTFSDTPSWYWASGGGGNGTFERTLWTGSVTTTTETYYRIYPEKPLADGSYTLSIRERDNAGNWSAKASRTIVVTPVLPPHEAIFVPTNQVLSWRQTTPSYKVYLAVSGITPKLVATTDNTSYAPSLVVATYDWYYVDGKGNRFPAKGYYTFTTFSRQ